MADGGTRLVAFLGVLALVIAGAAVAGFVMADTPPERSDASVEKNYFTSEEVLEESEMTPRAGDIELDSEASRTVLVSTDGDPSELEPVVSALVAHGHEVRIHGGGGTGAIPSGIVGAQPAPTGASGGGDLATELEDADALLVVGSSHLSEEDHGTVEEFVNAGGRVAITTDPGATDVNGLTSRFGVSIGDGYLYNMHENDANFQRVYADGADGDIAEGVDRVALDGAAPIEHDGGTTALTAGGETRYSTTRDAGTFAVAVRSGDIVVLGDTDLLKPLDYNRADNEQLLGNVLGHLTNGPADPYSASEEPTSGAPRPTPPESGTENGTATQPPEVSG
jgi:hypothetical protein